MIFSYGNYIHAANEVEHAFRQVALLDQRGNRRGFRTRLELKGILQGTSQADLDAKAILLQNAYAQNGNDAILFQDDGTTQTHVRIISGETLTGVRVVQPPSFQGKSGAEFATIREYTIVLEADFFGDSDILSFEETVTIQGTGGPRFAYLETLKTRPVRQVVNDFTLVRMTQSGSAVGYLKYPFAPAPLWPSLEDLGQRTFIRRAPKQQGRKFTDYAVSWTYKFTSDVKQDALPNKG